MIKYALAFLYIICSTSGLRLSAQISEADRPDCGRMTSMETGFWQGAISKDGTKGARLKYDFQACKLRRYTAKMARTCLSNKHLVLVGDSLMRYQYLSLVHFLHQGSYPASGIPVVEPTSPDFEPNICQEGDFRNPNWIKMQNFSAEEAGWPAFMMHTSSFFEGRETCDCHRGTAETTVENRYYKDPETNVSVTYFNKLYMPIHGHHLLDKTKPPLILSREVYEAIGSTNTTWKADHAEFVNTILPLTEPEQGTIHAVLWNQGIWSPFDDHMIEQTRDFFEKRSARAFFKSSTGTGVMSSSNLNAWMQEQHNISSVVVEKGWEVLDAARIAKDLTIVRDDFHDANISRWTELLDEGPQPTPDLNKKLDFLSVHWDLYHYRPWVYEEFNNVWLNMLCNDETSQN